jgi:hypothetical protein
MLGCKDNGVFAPHDGGSVESCVGCRDGKSDGRGDVRSE